MLKSGFRRPLAGNLNSLKTLPYKYCRSLRLHFKTQRQLSTTWLKTLTAGTNLVMTNLDFQAIEAKACIGPFAIETSGEPDRLWARAAKYSKFINH